MFNVRRRSIWRLHTLGSRVLDYFRVVYPLGSLCNNHVLHHHWSLLSTWKVLAGYTLELASVPTGVAVLVF